jgi:hypothetical protein
VKKVSNCRHMLGRGGVLRDDLPSAFRVVGLCGVLERFNACPIVRLFHTEIRLSRILTSSRDVNLSA